MNSITGVDSKSAGKRPKKKLITTAVCILLTTAITAIGINYVNSKNAKATAKQQATAIVKKGNLSVVVSGSGPISSTNKYDLTSNVSGTLTKVYYEDGDMVKAGDLIFEIDRKDTELQIKQLRNNIAQVQLSRNSYIKDLESSSITAPFDGEVQDIQVKEGDNISNNGSVLSIIDKSKLKLLVSFSNTYRSKLALGQEVIVNAYEANTEELYRVKGSISSISSPSYKTNDGSEVYNVGVVIDNSGFLTEGMVANAVINMEGNELKSKSSSTLSYINSMTVKASAGGTIKIIDVENGQNVKKGDELVQIDNEELQLTIQTNDLKLEDLNTQLQTAEEKLLDYKIYAPFDGTFTINGIKQGNSIKQGDILGCIANYDTMEFSIKVDELDIAKIQEGQTAKVTIDALAGTIDKPLKGTVTKIAVEGTSSDGVSTYPVTVQIQENTALKGGMNANAEIVVSQKNNVLYVPVDAVQKRNGKSFVTVVSGSDKEASGSNAKSQDNEGTEQKTERREVTTGISTEEYIEIISGLNEGEAVAVTSTASTGNMHQNMNGGMRLPISGGGPTPGGGGYRTRNN